MVKGKTINIKMVGTRRRKYGGRRKSYRRRQPYVNLADLDPTWKRGTEASIAQFGASAALASAEQMAARRKAHFYGRGLYSGRGGFWGDLWRGTAGVRGAVGDWARKQGGITGALGGLSHALGTGDYAVSNDIVNGGEGSATGQVPSFSDGPNEVVISHKEYVQDIYAPDVAGTFQNMTMGLNPALPSTFPWLSQVAQNYDEYEFGQLIFTFKSTVTDFVATNGQVGSIILTTQYNANDDPFTSKQDMMEYDGAVSGKVSGMVLAGVECDPSKNSGAPGKYTRSGPAPPSEDLKTYDLGTLNVGICNTPSQFNNQSLGELWVSYTVKLRKPKFFTTRALGLLTDIVVAHDGVGARFGLMGELGYGQQNRIGGQIVRSFIGTGTEDAMQYPQDNNTLYYVFPAQFSGNVEIKVTSVSGTATNGVFAAAGDSAGTGLLPINDLWNGAWGSTFEAASGVVDAGTIGIYHLQVVSPTTAQSPNPQDNVIVFAGQSGSTFHNVQITISVYNTGLNQQKAGHPLITDPVTDLVEPWP